MRGWIQTFDMVLYLLQGTKALSRPSLPRYHPEDRSVQSVEDKPIRMGWLCVSQKLSSQDSFCNPDDYSQPSSLLRDQAQRTSTKTQNYKEDRGEAQEVLTIDRACHTKPKSHRGCQTKRAHAVNNQPAQRNSEKCKIEGLTSHQPLPLPNQANHHENRFAGSDHRSRWFQNRCRMHYQSHQSCPGVHDHQNL